MQSRSRAVSGVVKAAAGVLLLTVAALLFAAPPAAAHAVLLGTDPGDGDILDSTPEIVTLTFNENITLPAEGVNVLDAAGAPVPSDARSVDATVQVTFDGDLDDGTYIVNWRVISADSHPVSGAFTFSVGAPSDTVAEVAPPAAAPGTEALTVGTQAVVYLGGLTAAGLVFFHFLVTALTRGGARIMRWSAVAGVLGMLAYVPAVYVWQNGLALSSVVTWDAVRDSFYAGGSFSAAALGAMLGIAGLAAAVTATSKGSGRASAAVACGGAGLALGSLLLTGHTRTFGPPLVLLTSDAVHATAAALWLGGVIGLVFVLRTGERGAAVAVVRFSSIAALVLAASAVTGIVMAWLILDSLHALTGTRYGLTLLVKIGAVAVVVLLAAWNRWKLVPTVGSEGSEPGSMRRLRRIVGAEAVVLLVVASITAFLVSQSPTAVPRDETGQYSVEIGAATLDAHVSPLRVGTNALEFTLRDVDGDAIDAVSEPDLRVFMPDPGIGPLSPAVTQTGPGRYEAVLDLPLPGEWEISVSARLSRFDNPVATLSVEVTE